MKILSLLKNSAKTWIAKDPFRQSAVIAYYSIFALPGLFVLILTLAGYFFGREVVSEQVFNQITNAIGEDSSRQIREIIINQQSKTREASVWGAIIGIATLLLGATGVFAQFQKSLNIIWEVEPDKSKSGILKIIRVRLFSFGLIVSIAFLLMISLLISTLLSAFGDWLSSQFSESLLVIIKIANILISLAVLTFLFAMMLKIFPDAKIKWSDVWIGSFVTALLFTLGKLALSLYFSKGNPASAFGASGSIILILLWVSYSSMIVFFGAEFTRQYALEYSGDAEPADHAKKEDTGKEDRKAERRKNPISPADKR
jgi:membrane protein